MAESWGRLRFSLVPIEPATRSGLSFKQLKTRGSGDPGRQLRQHAAVTRGARPGSRLGSREALGFSQVRQPGGEDEFRRGLFMSSPPRSAPKQMTGPLPFFGCGRVEVKMIDEEGEEESWSPSQRAVNKGSALDPRLQRAFQFSIPPAACSPEWRGVRVYTPLLRILFFSPWGSKTSVCNCGPFRNEQLRKYTRGVTRGGESGEPARCNSGTC